MLTIHLTIPLTLFLSVLFVSFVCPAPQRFLLFFCLLFFANCILSLLGVIGLKWIIIGRRVTGKQSWDECNYCQRWQMFLCAEQLRRGVG